MRRGFWLGMLLLATSSHARSAAFKGTQKPIPQDVRQRMEATSWREGCPVPIDQLRLLDVMHWGYDGKPKQGRIIVAEEVAASLLKVFKALYDAKFPIEQLRLVDDFGGSDDLSMEANNSSGFNCRTKTGQKVFSLHAYGLALDLNPVQNPYIKDTLVLPPSGSAYRNRNHKRMGLIRADDEVVKIFKAQGFEWGGQWSSLKDYQHFEKRQRSKPLEPPATP